MKWEKEKLITLEVISFKEYIDNKHSFKDCKLSLIGNLVLIERRRYE